MFGLLLLVVGQSAAFFAPSQLAVQHLAREHVEYWSHARNKLAALLQMDMEAGDDGDGAGLEEEAKGATSDSDDVCEKERTDNNQKLMSLLPEIKDLNQKLDTLENMLGARNSEVDGKKGEIKNVVDKHVADVEKCTKQTEDNCALKAKYESQLSELRMLAQPGKMFDPETLMNSLRTPPSLVQVDARGQMQAHSSKPKQSAVATIMLAAKNLMTCMGHAPTEPAEESESLVLLSLKAQVKPSRPGQLKPLAMLQATLAEALRGAEATAHKRARRSQSTTIATTTPSAPAAGTTAAPAATTSAGASAAAASTTPAPATTAAAGTTASGGVATESPETCMAERDNVIKEFQEAYVKTAELVEEWGKACVDTTCKNNADTELASARLPLDAAVGKLTDDLGVITKDINDVVKPGLAAAKEEYNELKTEKTEIDARCGDSGELSPIWEQIHNALDILTRCPSIKEISFVLPHFKEWATFVQDAVAQSDDEQDKAMDDACVAVNAGFRAAKTTEITQQLILDLPKTNTGVNSVMAKCGGCVGDADTDATPAAHKSGHKRVCWKAGKTLTLADHSTDCGAGTRRVLCVEDKAPPAPAATPSIF